MNIFKVAGKFLDQPALVAKFQKSVPYVLSGAAGIYGYNEVRKSPQEHKKNKAVKTFTTLAFTVASALAAPKITDKIFRAGKNIDKNIIKNKIMSPKEVKHLYQTMDRDSFNKLIPEPENITSKEIFSEIGRLSLFGLIPVVGGITGGIAGDKLTDKHWKEKLPDKIKEGAYQYLANIFLCNIGAGAALGIMEKMNIRSKAPRALGMVGGIITTGVIGGSAIANLIGEKIINPMFKSKDDFEPRHPEALDIGLHTDDIATVAVMSGLKWIEPALPLMYAISGYRAGIGYRNSKEHKCNEL
ncbi:MAG: hypothetical protein NC408_06645 [Candidatus Gastranaerophilales bacterium]|nr:hypothetical protein [Candidatus Gastranaerophilales bacterium]MCM1072792.1 hypothetical protein [Bacteroides sp.]